ncbi:hypothetical protein EFK50_19490 [Nocardioides marmoriginsengisoli]|uniref:Uncharacterized protein n=2 Tax=Nocardioides marmoriginsengisoli TaxID=661483 RepID=A0A3N0CAM4_9ACTN|nr:hypothetical protein EFK50_19490 [Nocardioides marmoriginsengisoli]
MLHQGTRWVMRVSRLRAFETDAGRERFVAAFEDRQLTASASRLSRWEYGHSRGSHRLLRAYEEGTGLEPYLLFAVNDRQRRIAEDRFAGEPSVDVVQAVEAEDVYEILDRAVTARPVSGSDWYAMAAFAVANGYFYLTPANTRLLARRLIVELARSIGTGYLLRFEALHLLASMSRLDNAMLDELTAMISAGTTGMFGDAVSLILRSDPEVGRKLAEQLRTAESPVARQGYEWITEILRDRAPLPEPLLDRGEVAARREHLCQDLPAWAEAHLEVEVTKPLVDNALGGRSRLVRHEASLLMMTAGVQDAINGSLLDAFESETDPVWRTRLANLNEYLIPPPDPERLETLALAEQDPEVRRALWNSRAHARIPIEPGPGVLAQLADPTAQGGVTMALGLSGSIDQQLLDRPELEDVRGMLAWWRSQGPALRL